MGCRRAQELPVTHGGEWEIVRGWWDLGLTFSKLEEDSAKRC